MKLTECVNCGEPLGGFKCKCKCCGAEYDDSGVHASFPDEYSVGTLKVGGVEYAVYLADATINRAFCVGTMIAKRKFVLIER